tara:strand:+ start:39 stop:314 length:276 start_codon:yes stop_codon:yes gene_type:complete
MNWFSFSPLARFYADWQLEELLKGAEQQVANLLRSCESPHAFAEQIESLAEQQLVSFCCLFHEDDGGADIQGGRGGGRAGTERTAATHHMV